MINKKGATPLSITLLVVLTIVLAVFTLYTFINSKASNVTTFSPELLDNIYQPKEQVTFFMTSIAEEAYEIAKNKPLIPDTPQDKQPTLEEEFIKEIEEKLGIGAQLGSLIPNYASLRIDYISEQKNSFSIPTEVFNNRLNYIHYEYLSKQVVDNIRAGDYTAGKLGDMQSYCSTNTGSTQSLTLPAVKKKILISPDINFLALFCNSLTERKKSGPISENAFIFAFPLSDNMQIKLDGKPVFTASYDYAVIIVLDNKPSQSS